MANLRHYLVDLLLFLSKLPLLPLPLPLPPHCILSPLLPRPLPLPCLLNLKILSKRNLPPPLSPLCLQTQSLLVCLPLSSPFPFLFPPLSPFPCFFFFSCQTLPHLPDP